MGEGGGDVEMGGCHVWITLQCSSVTFTVSGGSKVPFIPFGSSVFSVSHARFSSYL